MLLDVARERFHVAMNKRIVQLGSSALNQNVLVHFHVAHGLILTGGAALEMSRASAEKRKLVKRSTAVTQAPPEEEHLESNVIAVDLGIVQRLANFGGKLGSD